MADMPQVLATYDALVGVALGAGLTYGLGALNRRHQEKREDATRWYEARLDAYRELSRVMTNASRLNHFGVCRGHVPSSGVTALLRGSRD